MDDTLHQLYELGHSPGTREKRSQAAVRLIRALGPYRWAGLYDVTVNEIAVIAWDGPEPPTYLTTIGGTRGEMIQPVLRPSGLVVGTIDVESEKLNAFSDRDTTLLAACAGALQWLWQWILH
jgi:putative methionine-R-sulfoxide reductase with GAF domain